MVLSGVVNGVGGLVGRWEDEKAAGGLYRLKFGKLTVCIYCGAKRQCLDHVFPLSAAAGLRPGLGVRKELGPHGLCKVPACLNCNGLAGNKVFTSILAKRKFIQARIKKKYKTEMPMWDEDELSELGHTLRSYVVGKQCETDENWCRALWPRSRKLYARRDEWRSA